MIVDGAILEVGKRVGACNRVHPGAVAVAVVAAGRRRTCNDRAEHQVEAKEHAGAEAGDKPPHFDEPSSSSMAIAPAERPSRSARRSRSRFTFAGTLIARIS